MSRFGSRSRARRAAAGLATAVLAVATLATTAAPVGASVADRPRSATPGFVFNDGRYRRFEALSPRVEIFPSGINDGGYVTGEYMRPNRESDQIGALMAAAEADGLDLTGHGHRDHARQIALRRAHCGTRYYAIYQMPAGRCSPPTARPGTSMHERGLAIDFSCDGLLVRSRSDRCYRWLAGQRGRLRALQPAQRGVALVDDRFLIRANGRSAGRLPDWVGWAAGRPCA